MLRASLGLALALGSLLACDAFAMLLAPQPLFSALARAQSVRWPRPRRLSPPRSCGESFEAFRSELCTAKDSSSSRKVAACDMTTTFELRMNAI